MKTLSFRKAVRPGLLFTLALSGIAAGTQASARGPCGPTEQPNGIGVCEPCRGITTPGSITSANLTTAFRFAGIQNASYSVTNNVATFNIAGTTLANFNFKVPPPAPVSLPPVNGSIPLPLLPSITYTAYPSIPNLTITWGDWTGSDSSVVVNAMLSGEIDVHISADPIVVNPAITLTSLPVTISFSTDASGFATVSPSQVVVGPISGHGSVNGCGAFGWCDPLANDILESNVQSALRSSIASQFAGALNGQDNSSPFWVGLMAALIGRTALINDPARFPLPMVNQATPGGTATSWKILDEFRYADSKVTTTFVSSGGLCYIDCRPKTQAQLCGQNSCGTLDDGCGDIVTCPGTCVSGKICTNNRCTVCIPLTCANVGTTCGPISNGCGATMTCNTCGEDMACRNGRCVGFGPQFCTNCRNNDGVCIVGADGSEVCRFR